MIKGELYRTNLEQISTDDPAMMVVLGIGQGGEFIEEDRFNAYWIDDLIDVLQRTKIVLEAKYDRTNDKRPEYVRRKK
jgi:hypothetical protein